MSSAVKKTMVQPINVIFRFLQSKARVQIWLVEQPHNRIEGRVLGFDEWMNVTLDDACEVNTKSGEKKEIGRILLKGDNIVLMMKAPTVTA